MNVEASIQALKNGNKKSQDEFFKHFRGKYLQICRRYANSKEDAEERMLDGFYKFFTTIENFYYWHDEGVYTWIKRIMINECLMHLRNKSFFSIVTDDEASDISEQEGILDKLSTKEIMNLVARLPLGYRTVFNLFVIDGYDHIEIAQILEIKTGSSKSQLFKARNLLQKMLILNETVYDKEQSK